MQIKASYQEVFETKVNGRMRHPARELSKIPKQFLNATKVETENITATRSI